MLIFQTPSALQLINKVVKLGVNECDAAMLDVFYTPCLISLHLRHQSIGTPQMAFQ